MTDMFSIEATGTTHLITHVFVLTTIFTGVFFPRSPTHSQPDALILHTCTTTTTTTASRHLGEAPPAVCRAIVSQQMTSSSKLVSSCADWFLTHHHDASEQIAIYDEAPVVHPPLQRHFQRWAQCEFGLSELPRAPPWGQQSWSCSCPASNPWVSWDTTHSTMQSTLTLVQSQLRHLARSTQPKSHPQTVVFMLLN